MLLEGFLIGVVVTLSIIAIILVFLIVSGTGD